MSVFSDRSHGGLTISNDNDQPEQLRRTSSRPGFEGPWLAHMNRRLLLSDYAGHPFTIELARALQERGECVTYSYCAAALSPKGLPAKDLVIVPLSEGLTFEKYRPARRLWSEIRYGLSMSRVVWAKRPTTHVVCNMPLVSAAIVWLLSRP